MISSQFNFQIISLDSVISTNIYALELIRKQKVREGTVIWSQFQEKGKGQLENVWHSNAYKNLTFSLILEPRLKVGDQFLLSQKISLAIADCIDSMSVKNSYIKWPNDILIENKKLGGILIENSIQGTNITRAVIGIGLNINETVFPAFSREATSLCLVNGRSFIVEEVLHQILFAIKTELSNGKQVQERYLNRLYGYAKTLPYKDKDGIFEGVIVGVMPNGGLQVNRAGKLRTYQNKEIVFLA